MNLVCVLESAKSCINIFPSKKTKVSQKGQKECVPKRKGNTLRLNKISLILQSAKWNMLWHSTILRTKDTNMLHLEVYISWMKRGIRVYLMQPMHPLSCMYGTSTTIRVTSFFFSSLKVVLNQFSLIYKHIQSIFGFDI